jgi:murein DD-endopeptidase MepM/ murein hydrolase activator NlpD
MSPVRTLFQRALLTAGTLSLTVSACTTEELGSTGAPTGEVAADDDLLPAIDLDAEDPRGDAARVAGVVAVVALTPKSSGFYSFPYEAGTSVHVTNDAITHTPVNRIDMSGTSGGPYKVVAAAAGRVKYVVDNHTGDGCANNNYVWIAHSNGEWTKYTHIATNSATNQAGIAVGDWVRAGQFIGIESDVGCASGDHVHFEVGVPDDLSDPIQLSGGYIKGINLVPKVCGIAGQTFVAGEDYVVPEVRPGGSEYTRAAVSDGDFQAIFDSATNCGYEMAWNDGYDRNGTATFNVVFKPNDPAVGVISHRRLTATELDDKIDLYGDQGYELSHLDVYNVGTAVRYAAIFKSGASVPTTATYHGVSAATHQNSFNTLTAAGWRPRVVSATSVNGTLTYGAIYVHGLPGSYVTHSSQTAADYQTNYTANKDAGRRLIYLNSYVHDGAARYTAIWASTAPADVFAKHGMSAASLQTWWDNQTGAGKSTGAITGMFLGGASQFAAYWFD